MNIVSILIGRKNSKGFPGKNTHNVCGHPLCYYPMIAAKQSHLITNHFVSTDDPEIMKIAKDMNFTVIDRPPILATDKALGEDVFVHTYYKIKARYGNIDMCVLLFANAPMVTGRIIDTGIEALYNDCRYDSCCTVSKYNMFNPSRMKQIENGYLKTSNESDITNADCDRDSFGDHYMYDCCCAVVKPNCLENINYGIPPQRWLGQDIYPIINNIGLDIDYEWQLGQAEYWVKNYSKE